MSNSLVPVGGITPFSTVDWPDKIAAVLYLTGCPWRCPYCHNPEFVKPSGGVHPWEDVLALLRERRGFLDGVVFSGGEPTMHPGLGEALRQVRALGFQTALHTGGNYPGRLGELLDRGLLDWVGFDVKAPFEDYQLITGQPDSGQRARLSLETLVRSGVDYEMRTTVYTPVLDVRRLETMASQAAHLGAGNLVLQRCLNTRTAEIDLHSVSASLFPLVGPVAVRDPLPA
jgi:pyruvate formate lyase activating enzyme